VLSVIVSILSYATGRVHLTRGCMPRSEGIHNPLFYRAKSDNLNQIFSFGRVIEIVDENKPVHDFGGTQISASKRVFRQRNLQSDQRSAFQTHCG
jgi:hypothetical protein